MNKTHWLQSDTNRFWSKVSYPGNDQDCWEWIAYRDKDGYGIFDNKRSHRLSWEFYNGDIPNNLHVCHECDNPPCCNPDHLFLGTALENNQDRTNKGRQCKGSNSHFAKTTEITIKQILVDIGNNKYQNLEQIKKDYNVNSKILRGIFRRELWKHITDIYSDQELSILKNKVMNRILTSDEIIEIKDRLKNGDRQCDIANDFNVQWQMIYHIKSGKSHKYF